MFSSLAMCSTDSIIVMQQSSERRVKNVVCGSPIAGRIQFALRWPGGEGTPGGTPDALSGLFVFKFRMSPLAQTNCLFILARLNRGAGAHEFTKLAAPASARIFRKRFL